MDVALVEHAENDVDHDQRGGDQVGLARERGLERLGGALEGADRAWRGMPSSASARWIACDAWPRAMPGARLNDRVTDGN